ncbi:toll/interleukin-1 receptor domain-containing protein [Amycolatopsis sp. NPDC048633]|uniref:toll/interleukin-1 receptor domain-containing protein n=1 Tax=Amycolatopsis sp. NPDC048633 TaxID=3157095 RepID=UPI0033DB904C
MPIFISYSHADKDFVDKLAIQLVQNSVSVWLDRWEIRVGDSLISKVQEAIKGASALLVILSRTSVNSAWVQKELNSGLIRELDERRVVVLPILIEDCQIPLFLREKMYADFRENFDDGLKSVLEAVAGISNAHTGRVDDPQYHSDWAFTWGVDKEGRAGFFIAIVEQAEGQPYTVLANVEIFADKDSSLAYVEMVKSGRRSGAHRNILQITTDKLNAMKGDVVRLVDQFQQIFQYDFLDETGGYTVRISVQRLGMDTGRDVIYRLGDQLRQILGHMNDVSINGITPD